MAYFTDNFKEIEAVQFINAASEELKEAFNVPFGDIKSLAFQVKGR